MTARTPVQFTSDDKQRQKKIRNSILYHIVTQPEGNMKNTRDATVDDLPQIVQIMNYYIENTIISFRMEALTVPTYQEIFTSVRTQNLPFLVCEIESKITGFAYAMGYRIPAYQGYRHTVEITIYVHPEYHSRGVGSHLMNNLMDELKKPKNSNAPEIKEVLSVMSLNEEGPGNGYGLRDWYGRWGFVQVGHMKKVGHKLGKWIDVLVLQASL